MTSNNRNDIKLDNSSILTINGGSSSVRFALYEVDQSPQVIVHGKLDRIGSKGTSLTINHADNKERESHVIDASDHSAAIAAVLNYLEQQPAFATVKAVGHRIVHGMAHVSPQPITPALLNELRSVTAYDPEHLPHEIKLIETIQQRHPSLPQIACFDTAFHRGMPSVAKLLPIPRRYQTHGVERYGFHGLSFSYLMEELIRMGDPAATHGRVILAHLGGGASMAAVLNGNSIDTSMGFTPTAGLVMGTRTGDIDPGLIYYLAHAKQMSTEQFQHMVNHESGLLGISERSSDVRDLLECEADDVHAAEALALFCYQAKKWIGSFSTVLSGLDTLVFAGGIGENAPVIRERICTGLEFLGVKIDVTRNADNAPLISAAGSQVNVRVIRTNEELMMARMIIHLVGLTATESR